MKKQGELSELRFYLRAHELDYVVSKPFGDNAKYDFVVDGGTELFKVQVKSVSVKDTTRRTDKYRINATYGAKTKKRYSTDECDILSAYVIPEDVWYLIPVSEITGVSVNLYPHKDAGSYEGFREAWGLFY